MLVLANKKLASKRGARHRILVQVADQAVKLQRSIPGERQWGIILVKGQKRSTGYQLFYWDLSNDGSKEGVWRPFYNGQKESPYIFRTVDFAYSRGRLLKSYLVSDEKLSLAIWIAPDCQNSPLLSDSRFTPLCVRKHIQSKERK